MKGDSNPWLAQSHSNGVELGLKELMYYKAKAPLLDLTPRSKVRHRLAGQYLAPHKGRGMEFAEVRLYQQGDDIRSIDWRVTARTGKAHTKLFQEEKERPVFVFCDFSDSMLFGSELLLKSVQAAHITALLAWAAGRRGDRIGGLVFNQHTHRELKPASRDKGVLALLHQMLDLHGEALAGIDKGAEPGFNAQLKRLNQLAKPGSLVYLVSDFLTLDASGLKQLQLLTRHCEVVACQVGDPFETRLPEFAGSVNISAGQSTLSLPLMDAGFRRSFSEKAQRAWHARIDMLKRSGLLHLALSAAEPLENQLLSKGT